jgi:hypothetical protein
MAALLAGDVAAPALLPAFRLDDVFDRAQLHGVLPLVADVLSGAPAVADDVRERCRRERLRLAATDLALDAELRRVLSAFAEHRIDVLVIKGSHLAYTFYERSDLRPRVDSDLLVRREQRDRATGCLRDLGYVSASKVEGDINATQQLYSRQGAGSVAFRIDLHWRWASPPVFAHVLASDDLYSQSIPIEPLGPAGRGPCAIHALMIACVHRVAHHHDEGDRLLWLYDIHLIARQLSQHEWDRFIAMAIDQQVLAVCLAGLRRAAETFRTPMPVSLRTEARMREAAAREPTAAYLSVRSPAEAVLADLRSLGWRDRLRLLGEHAFPGPEYMRHVYAPESPLPLPALYVRRIVRGAQAWLRRRPVS